MLLDSMWDILESSRVSDSDKQYAIRCITSLAELSWEMARQVFLDEDKIEELYIFARIILETRENTLQKYHSTYAD